MTSHTTRDALAPDSGLAAIRDSAALFQQPKAVFGLSGKDPVGMVNAVLTNDVPEEPGRGAYALLLNPKGRVQADLRVLKASPDAGYDGEILIVTEPEGAGAVREILGRYAPFSRVKLEELPDWSLLGLYGPAARKLLGTPTLEEHATATVEVGGAALVAAGVTLPAAGCDLIGPAGAIRAAQDHLARHGATPAHPDVLETARIEAGVPRFGQDMTPDNFPAETGVLERAISLTKGCYPGQETVARMRYRGHPNRTLRRFAIRGPVPRVRTPIVQDGKDVGLLTSVAPLPVDDRRLALGYLHRNADPHDPLRAGEAVLFVAG